MPTYFIGLDLGQKADYTALSVVERQDAPNGEREYRLRHLERLQLDTSYTQVATRVKALQQQEPLTSAYVVVDITGVGLPVFEMLRAAEVENLFGISIHGGDAVSREGHQFRVPKRDLVSALQVLLQQGTLKFAEGLQDGDVLRHELQHFKAKINIATGHDTYEAWRENDHDDLVLSLAMACWFAEHGFRPVQIF